MTSANLNNAGAQPAWTFTTDPLLNLLALNHASNAPFTLALLPGSPATQTADCYDFNYNVLVPVDERGSLRPPANAIWALTTASAFSRMGSSSWEHCAVHARCMLLAAR